MNTRKTLIACTLTLAMAGSMTLTDTAHAGRKGDKIAIGVAALTIGALLASQSQANSHRNVVREHPRHHGHHYGHHGPRYVRTVAYQQPMIIQEPQPRYVIQAAEPVVETRQQSSACVPYEGYVEIEGQARKIKTILCPTN